MIFLCGIPSEPSLKMVIDQLRNLGVPRVVFNQRRFAEMTMEFEIREGVVDGWMGINGTGHKLSDFIGVYTRLMDHHLLPEVIQEPLSSPVRRYCDTLHATIMQWYEIAPCRVLNRKAEIGSNYSKPYQAQLIIKQGFSVPETLITNDPDAVHQFRQKHDKIIYKSISCVRSIVKTLEDKDLARLPAIKFCPIQFQEYVEGDNVRVHTVGNQVFAVSIASNAVDYRYSHLQGEQERLTPIKLEDELAERCICLSQVLGLEFAGIDLKLTPEGEAYCLEVNACPAFSYYELHTGIPIAQAVARLLAGMD